MNKTPPFAKLLVEALRALDPAQAQAHPEASMVALARWGRSHEWPCMVVMGHISGPGGTDAGCIFLECEGFMLDPWGNRRMSSIIGNVKRMFSLEGSFYFHGEPRSPDVEPDWMTAAQAHMCQNMLASLQARDLARATASASTNATPRRI